MSRLVGGVGVLVLAMMAPIVLVAGAFGVAAAGSQAGSSSVFVRQLQALGYENGRLADETLTVVSARPGYECKVAKVGFADQAWVALVEAARLDSIDIEGGWCYRTFESQLAAWNRRRCYIPGNCDGDPYPPTAEPGTSLHGWGLAIDVWGAANVTLGCSSPELAWLFLNAPRFGWVNPDWARCGRLEAEPWHWEYVGIELVDAEIGDGPQTRKDRHAADKRLDAS
ncbi:D-alanyl-D-alanine carboxypeptidase [bacterium BMS3Bbin01]|nr:D-alanyl-D-alanine carboxypeptidase [bacterium BMS3Bbin01]